jgi:hypothetical protein
MKMSARRPDRKAGRRLSADLATLHQIQNSYEIMEFVLDRLAGLFARRVMIFSTTKEQAE